MEQLLIQKNADELQRISEMNAREAEFKIQMDQLQYDLRIARATKESLVDQAKLEGAHGEEKSSSPELDANADLSQ